MKLKDKPRYAGLETVRLPKKFTVLLLYPDYVASNYGQETYMTSVAASDAKQAVSLARAEMRENQKEDVGPIPDDDMFVVSVIAGEHQDIKP